MSKSDLATRPIFHYKEDAIKAHMLICFVALALSRHMELATGLSLRKIVDLLWTVTEAHIIDTVTNEPFILTAEIPEPVHKLIKKLGCHTK